MKLKNFKERFVANLKKKYSVCPSEASVQQIHEVLSAAVMEDISESWERSRKAHDSIRKASYLSMEFLVGRAVYNNLLCLGITEQVEKELGEYGVSLGDMEEIEDAALGNGGLGRLAACFLDSAATLNLPLDGYGIRYKYGLFKQYFKDGFQHEKADDWTKYGDAWGKRCEGDAVEVHYADQTVKAVPYDYPVIGYGTDNIGTLRLWQSEPVNTFDFELFNKQKYAEASAEERRAADISRVLYPNDDTNEGKILRLKQEYFFSSASIADLMKKHKKRFGTMDNFAEYNVIQLNDTHPVIAVPEFIRKMILEEGYSFEQAFEIAVKVFNYTNHTIMAEALEKWNSELMEQVIPQIYEIIVLLNEQFIGDMYRLGIKREEIDKMKLIRNNTVYMANIAVYSSSHVNGVAALHTEILKKSALKEWYSIYPERFINITNGITQRRWLALCNKELSALITKLLCKNEWITELESLKSLEKYADDENVIKQFIEIKDAKKSQLADYIEKNDGIKLNKNAVFEIQVKRMHEYKRQLMNALSILYIYFGIKDGTIKDFTPTAFIFGAKSAPGYRRAKGIIKLINEIAKLVNSDEDTKDLIQVVFVSNYRVSYAEKLVAGADISEQISTSGTEASGTGNMKFMLNGTVTLGTLDGANVEIVAESGEENNYIFGAKTEELEKIMPEYDPRSIVEADEKIRRVVNALIDGTVSDDGTGLFRELYFSLLEGTSWHQPDNYYVLGDLKPYVEAKLKANADYTNRMSFARKCWLNMCNAGKFSSDRSISEYAESIWKISEIVI